MITDHGDGMYVVHDDESIMLDPIARVEPNEVFEDDTRDFDVWIGWRPDPVATIYEDADVWVCVSSIDLPPGRRLFEPMIHSDLDSAIIAAVNAVIEIDGNRDDFVSKVAGEVADSLKKSYGIDFEILAERILIDSDDGSENIKFHILFDGDFSKLVSGPKNERPESIQRIFSKAGFDETFTFSLAPRDEWMLTERGRKRIASKGMKSGVIDTADLIDAATRLIHDDEPTQAKLRRGVSTLYYSLFHHLAASNARLIVGDPAGNPEEWERVYRALDHGDVKKCRDNKKVMQKLSPSIRDYVDRFCELQIARNEADYSPYEVVTRYSARWYIISTSRAIEVFDRASESEKMAFAIHLLIGDRKNKSGQRSGVPIWQRDRDQILSSFR